jgi:hypothetical protein
MPTPERTTKDALHEVCWPPLMLLPYAAWQNEWFIAESTLMTLKDEVLLLGSVKVFITFVSSAFLIEKIRSYYRWCREENFCDKVNKNSLYCSKKQKQSSNLFFSFKIISPVRNGITPARQRPRSLHGIPAVHFGGRSHDLPRSRHCRAAGDG